MTTAETDQPATDTPPVDTPAGDEPAGEPPGEKPAGGRPAAAPAGPNRRSRSDSRAPGKAAQLTRTSVRFLGPTTINGSTIGTEYGEGPAQPARSATGKVREADVRALLAHFVPPPMYDEAVARLHVDRLVVLDGPGGCGQTAAAVSLLRDFTSGPLVALSPVITMKQLVERTYEPRYGYLVVGRQNEEQSAESTFNWMTVRDQVCEASAYLVVTGTSTAKRSAPGSGRPVAWQRPPVGDVLRAHLDAVEPDDDELNRLLARLESTLSDELSMGELVESVQRIAAADDREAALESLDQASGAHVHAWFEEHGDDTDAVLDVTALAFLNGAHDRSFESLRRLLAESVEKAVAAGKPAAEESPRPETKPLPKNRVSRLGSDSLICAREVPAATGPRRALVFRADAYRRHVLEELWNRYEVSFWDGVREWIFDLVAGLGDDLDNVEVVAYGLALLADVDFEEVRSSFLEPWSRGHLGWIGQTAATYVLWLMCYQQRLVPVALATATRWVGGSPSQRWTAAVAFSDELGVRFPTEAVRRLWHLVTNGSDPEATASFALSNLFTNLVEAGEDAGVVITKLERQLDVLSRRQSHPRPDDQRLRELTRGSIVHVLCARHGRTGHVAVMSYLHRQPELANSLARLWVTALRNHPTRMRTLQALWHGLESLKKISDDPERDAATLGRAMADHLPHAEWHDFEEQFRRIDSMFTADRAQPLVEALLAALDRLNPPGTGGTT